MPAWPPLAPPVRRADEGFFASVAEATRSGEDARLREVVARRTRKEGGEATDDERFFRFTQWFGDNLSKAAELARCMRPMQPLPAHHNMVSMGRGRVAHQAPAWRRMQHTPTTCVAWAGC